ncbi:MULTISPECIES: SDR family NAD(P)-dependent oxidoreductase [Candidatus Microthrix]|jgi:NAD(P)-dependent dehydrogenase (short-subunit alcohol dehydrogenase family)|uniref:Putative short-chain dehydrogenase/reductase n=1 Tax=Candidatus Neomicrothrix parvicella RN1 TaxID=1229780 RepID=R4Z7C3_9ACTN|nr:MULTISPECIES: glucose 1-dehydrogenase [Microthrix]NLH68332.1 glucose 1-dehydrogenase [Candidatus Microthrix parvicella]MBK6500986.1 glucose 1-dehydrogenase [Candidatus Microthrix sp.]MBK7021045.1 glucose 1-dehydrogenase [Candidatus Microthrix sp.]MBK7323025.1 glucose 1-dehydrogenase [Candidatus Microthrix sp.]MBL0206217.1 glucose 1-dehydrogenase [Candidatus Microthrix sp.]
MTAHEPAGDPAPVRSPGELFDLTGQVAIVTGASSGLGRRFGRVLHASGAHVVLAARREDRLVDLAAELNGLPGNARAVAQACDVSDEVATRALVDRAVAEFGTVDVVVNNAGVGDGKRAIDETNDRVRAMLEVNLVGLFTLSRQAATVMLANGEGSIINIASVLGLVASAPVQQAAYCAAKGGVVNLTRQLGAEWGRKGVRVNAIAPGWFHSEMTAETMFDDPAAMDFVLRETPMGRAGEADELDGALLFLASGASRFVTGITLPVDGGWTAR